MCRRKYNQNGKTNKWRKRNDPEKAAGVSAYNESSESQQVNFFGILKTLFHFRYTLLVANTSIEQCSLPCDSDDNVSTFFNHSQRNLLRLVALVSGVVCAACTLFTIITFLIDIGKRSLTNQQTVDVLERFEFPERSILYMSFCYFCVALTYLVGGSMAKHVSCSVLSSTQTPLVTQV